MNRDQVNTALNIKHKSLGPPPPPTLLNATESKQNHSESRPLCSDPEIEETIRRLTQNLKSAPERLVKDDPRSVGDGTHQSVSKAATNSGIPMHEAFVLSIEELDNNSVNELMFPDKKIKQRQKHIYESPEARARRLARNAERMRERRSNESDEEYRIRLFKMAEASRLRRRNESDIERAMRLVRDAARQRLRRALESSEKRSERLAKLAKRAREVRQNETPEQRADRLRKLAEHHRNKYARQRQSKRDVNIKQEDTSQSGAATYGESLLQQNSQNATAKENCLPFVHPANARHNDFVQSPSSSSSGSSEISQSYQHMNQTQPQYQFFRTNHFPELPPHLTPNRPSDLIPSQWIPNQFPEISQNFSHTSLDSKYYQKIQQALSPTTLSNHVTLPIPPVAATTSSILTPPTTPQFYRPQTQYQALWPPVTNAPETNFVRGRPIKIFPTNDYRTINPDLRDEAERQQRMNDMLEAQINQMLTSPRQARGRPNKGKETDPEREERLRKMAEARRMQRQRETPDERAARLKDLADRARKRREAVLATETEEERKVRLQRQAEYARMRRLKSQTPEALKLAEQKARNLYTTLHGKQGKENDKY